MKNSTHLICSFYIEIAEFLGDMISAEWPDIAINWDSCGGATMSIWLSHESTVDPFSVELDNFFFMFSARKELRADQKMSLAIISRSRVVGRLVLESAEISSPSTYDNVASGLPSFPQDE